MSLAIYMTTWHHVFLLGMLKISIKFNYLLDLEYLFLIQEVGNQFTLTRQVCTPQHNAISSCWNLKKKYSNTKAC